MGTVLHRLSLYLAGLTGLGADTCFYVVLAALVVTVALLVLAVFIGAKWRSALLGIPLSFEKAQAPGKSPAPVFWAGRWFREDQLRGHLAICGATCSGKSLLLSLYLRSVISQITVGSDRRLMLFDPAHELNLALFENAQVPVYSMLPSDARSSRWNLARDFTTPAAVVKLCDALAPEPPGDTDAFLAKAIQGLLGGGVSALNRTRLGEWDLADVVRILEREDLSAQELAGVERTRLIEATLKTYLDRVRTLTAFWSRSHHTFSLAEFVRGEGILIVGRDPRYAAVVDPLNRLLLTQLFSQLLDRNDSPTRRTYIVIDGFPAAAGGEKPLPGFRDICERGASRGVVVAATYQSYADMEAIYKDETGAMLAMLQNRVFLRAGDIATAIYASEMFGRTRERDNVPKQDHGGDVPYHKFLELPPASPETGITGYWLSPSLWRSSEPFHLRWSWIMANLPNRFDGA